MLDERKAFSLSRMNSMEHRISNGKLLKWYQDNQFIKTSSINYNEIQSRFMYESYSEVIASALIIDLGFRFGVVYKPCEITIDNDVTTVGCYCDSFLKEGELYISIGKLMDIGKLQLPIGLDAYSKLKNDINNKIFNEILDNTLILDYIILNQDRHYGNFGLVRKTNGTLKSAPIFDSGDSLFGSKFIDSIEYTRELEQYTFSRPFHNKHTEQIKLVKKRISKVDLRTTHKTLNYLVNNWYLPTKRANFIYKLIDDRIKDLIKQ